MIIDNTWQTWLQLFAEGGEGGGEGSADSGAIAPDAGVQALLEMGVPKDKIRKNRKYAAPAAATAPESAPEAAEQAAEQATDDTTPTEATAENQPTAPRMTWDEILADPEYNKAMQSTVQARLKDAKPKAEALDKLTPALEVLARHHGIDPANIDYDSLAEAINNDRSYYEDAAMENGESVEETMSRDQRERSDARTARAEQETLREEMFRNHMQGLEHQAEAMKATFPDFDLKKELQIPAFARMTAPGVGLSVEDAYWAVHRKELTQRTLQVAANKTAEQITSAIQSKARRPDEAGTSAQAPSVATFDYSKASKAQRDELKRRIRAGEKITPGHEFR